MGVGRGRGDGRDRSCLIWWILYFLPRGYPPGNFRGERGRARFFFLQLCPGFSHEGGFCDTESVCLCVCMYVCMYVCSDLVR